MIDALLDRIGLAAAPAPDLEGLFLVHRAFLDRVPYEDIAVQLGETGPLEFDALAARVVGGRGGYCFELNTVLAGLLRALGFSVTMHQAVVGGEGPTNHMALLVWLDGSPWLADAGLGEGFVDPLPLRPGGVSVGPLTYTLTREPAGTWWIGQHEWSTFTGFRMAPEEASLEDFEPHHRRLATDPASPFVRTLVVQRPSVDRITTLRARTLTSVGPLVDTRHVVASPDEFASVLSSVFGLSGVGVRLWDLARAQHAAFVASR